jgi:hypothetical protein
MESFSFAPAAPQAAQGIGLAMIIFITLMALAVSAIKAIIFCKIFSKAGHPWALGLLMMVPIADVIMAFVLAFGTWPIERQLQTLQQQHLQ